MYATSLKGNVQPFQLVDDEVVDPRAARPDASKSRM